MIYETTAAASAFDELPGGPVVLDSWHHVAVSWDGSFKRLYVDGTSVAVAAAQPLDATQPLYIGGDLDVNVVDNFFVGSIDEVVFYDRALADDEIAALAQ
jgi:hypothetical protein